jgi:hypothetical protein
MLSKSPYFSQFVDSSGTHLSNGQDCDESFAFRPMKHPHSLHVHVGRKRRSHAPHIFIRCSNVSLLASICDSLEVHDDVSNIVRSDNYASGMPGETVFNRHTGVCYVDTQNTR